MLADLDLLLIAVFYLLRRSPAGAGEERQADLDRR